MKQKYFCTILLVAFILIHTIYGQETRIDKEKEKLEEVAMEREHECRFEMSDGQHISLRHMKKKRAPDYIFESSDNNDDEDYTYYFNF